jgi:Xaa-Pro aminopeptidase
VTRGERLSKLVAEKELDQLFVSELTNVSYLTGFTGTNGACLVGGEELVFFTDFRYTERAKSEVSPEWERPEAERELIPQIVARMKGRVGFEDAKLSVRQLARLEAAAEDEVEFVPAGDPPIVAAGENGALPHAEPGDREIGSGELVVFDMGSLLDGYCSDCTRTFATGEPGDEAREVYDLVLTAQLKALEAVRPAASGKEVDAVAREIISEAGHGDHFGHGLGHGVGLEVHEGPRLAASSEDDLLEGNVVTVEPGIYLTGRFGVRIEDLVTVTADGYRNLSGLPKDLQVVE